MKIIFTRGGSLLSKAIRGVTDEPVSHCALEFGVFVVHSNLLGVHLEWSANFRAHTEVVLQLARTKDSSTQAFEDLTKLGKLLKTAEFSPYDFGALCFSGLSMVLRKYLKIPLPKTNLWQSSGMYLCTEWVGSFVDTQDNSMITPFKLYEKLKSSGEWGDSNGKETQGGEPGISHS